VWAMTARRAAGRAQLATPAVAVSDSYKEQTQLQWDNDPAGSHYVKDAQPHTLQWFEEAEAYRHLMDQFGLTHEEVAERVAKSRPTITNTLRLLSLPDAVKAQLESGELTAGHARAVLAIEGADGQVAFAREIVTRRLSKSESEGLAAARRTRPVRRRAHVAATDLQVRALAEELTRGLGTRVRISRGPRGGKIEIEFYSDAELDRLADRLRDSVVSR